LGIPNGSASDIPNFGRPTEFPKVFSERTGGQSFAIASLSFSRRTPPIELRWSTEFRSQEKYAVSPFPISETAQTKANGKNLLAGSDESSSDPPNRIGDMVQDPAPPNPGPSHLKNVSDVSNRTKYLHGSCRNIAGNSRKLARI
jgi:hypothetical protein